MLNPSTGDNNPGKRKASVIVRNQPVEILETDSNDESSPTLQVQGSHELEGLLILLEAKQGHLYCYYTALTEASAMLSNEENAHDGESLPMLNPLLKLTVTTT